MFRKHMVITIAVVALGGGLIHAQPADSDDPGITVDMGTTGKLTPQQMTNRTTDLINEMRGVLTRVLELQKAARKNKDVIKLNCVNDKLLQVKQLLNIAEASRNNLIEAITGGDEGERYHQFTQVTVSHEKTMGLRDEAEACIGEELTFVGPTDVEVVKPPIIDDPTQDDPFNIGGLDFERPAFASPYN